VNARVNNGAFQYPDLPLPARDIGMNLSLVNPGGSADSTVVNIERFHMRMGANPVDGYLFLRMMQVFPWPRETTPWSCRPPSGL
jgi:hypothetical protein